jgi:hypothetical protein
MGPAEIDKCLATVARMLTAESMTEAANLLRRAEARVEETGYDNWNGGTTTYTVYLSIDASSYALLGKRLESLENQLNERLKAVLKQRTEDWYSVSITPKIEMQANWREVDGEISEVRRRNIFDGLRIDKVAWYGRLNDVEFLERLFDLKALPSLDSRFDTAAGDIWQHRINNEDMDDDWVYEDRRLNLLRGPTAKFLSFLCETVHPVVRPSRDEAIKLARQYNDQLRLDGWMLIEQELIAGRPRFVAQRMQMSSGRAMSRAKSVADALDAGWMQKEIQRMENAAERDPALAIGTAKDLVESCCKSILSKRGVTYSPKADLPALTKLLSQELRLVPDDIPSAAKGAEIIKLILRNLTAQTQYLAELRGLYGSGHGREGKHRGLEPRHARLAVASAVAFIDFVTETYHQRHVT